MKIVSGILFVIVVAACSKTSPELKSGIWRGVLETQGQELPFNFEVTRDSSQKINVIILNGSERLLLDEISITGDSVRMILHIFDAELRARIDNDSLTGYFTKNPESNYKLPFRAAFGQDFRFDDSTDSSSTDFSGTYAVTFLATDDTTAAVGVFNQKGNHVNGTFLTSTGDYRYLEGSVIGNKLHLSAFDGNHVYLFTAEKTGEHSLTGDFWSGKARHKTWVATKDEKASLPDEDSLTFLKEGYDKIDFSFPGLDGNVVRLADEKYKNKVVIIQLMGTWCPNCMDETKFLTSWYNQNKDRGVEIIGLAYEAKDDFTYARTRVKKMKEKFQIPYTFAIAGTSNKEQAKQTLPMLQWPGTFPTTIFIGKDGNVKKIHTGFSGPGTGEYYEKFVDEFSKTVNELLKEN